ncbi:hypothetical protein ACX1NX_15630 [Acinetobacter sp. ANC 5383]
MTVDAIIQARVNAVKRKSGIDVLKGKQSIYIFHKNIYSYPHHDEMKN